MCKVSGLYTAYKLACTKNKYNTQEGGNPVRIRQVSVCIIDILKHVWENQVLFATPQD